MRTALLVAALTSTSLLAQTPSQPDWAKLDEETMRHFQAILRLIRPIRPAVNRGSSTM